MRGCNCQSASDREVHGVTGKQKSNVELLQEDGAVAAFREDLELELSTNL